MTELTVEDIMRERGVGKRWAYSILREQRQEQYTETEAPSNQRAYTLSALRRRNDVHNTRELVGALQHEGHAIDEHDANKVLWSLQKTGHVKFREHQNPKYLYAIRLTALGEKVGAERSILDVPRPQRGDPPAALVPAMDLLDEQDQQTLPVEAAAPDNGWFPLLDALLEREKERLEHDNQALKLMEAADLVRDINQGAAEMLDELAKEADLPYPTEVEAEYMRYAAKDITHG